MEAGGGLYRRRFCHLFIYRFIFLRPGLLLAEIVVGQCFQVCYRWGDLFGGIDSDQRRDLARLSDSFADAGLRRREDKSTDGEDESASRRFGGGGGDGFFNAVHVAAVCGDSDGDRQVRFTNGASPRLFSLLQSDFHSALDGGFGGNGGGEGSSGNERNGA